MNSDKLRSYIFKNIPNVVLPILDSNLVDLFILDPVYYITEGCSRLYEPNERYLKLFVQYFESDLVKYDSFAIEYQCSKTLIAKIIEKACSAGLRACARINKLNSSDLRIHQLVSRELTALSRIKIYNLNDLIEYIDKYNISNFRNIGVAIDSKSIDRLNSFFKDILKTEDVQISFIKLKNYLIKSKMSSNHINLFLDNYSELFLELKNNFNPVIVKSYTDHMSSYEFIVTDESIYSLNTDFSKCLIFLIHQFNKKYVNDSIEKYLNPVAVYIELKRLGINTIHDIAETFSSKPIKKFNKIEGIRLSSQQCLYLDQTFKTII